MIPKNNELFDMSETIAKDLFEGVEYPWEVLSKIHDYILKLGNSLSLEEYDNPKEGVWIAKDAKIYDSAYIGSPCIIDHKAEIRHCAFIRGDAIIGKEAVIGNSCEVKNAVVFNNCEVPHFNYVGDSILGFHAHLGAGAVTSNVKADRKNVVVKDQDEAKETGRKKFGAALGDYAEIGCNAVLNPGSIIGKYSNVYPTSCVRGVVPAYSIRKNDGSIVKKID